MINFGNRCQDRNPNFRLKILRPPHRSVQKIQQENNLYTTKLTIGQELKIPGRQKVSKPTSNGQKTYTVKRGDSPYHIAVLHNMPLERFLRMNDLTPRSKIFPGQEVTVE